MSASVYLSSGWRWLKSPMWPFLALLRRVLRPPLESMPDAPDLFHVYRLLARHPDLQRKPGGWVYRGRYYPDYLTIGGASYAISREAAKYYKGKGIDVGAGNWPLPGAIPVDVWRGPGLGRSVGEFANGSLDYVFSSHCLEHIGNWQEALSQWVSKLKEGGIAFLYLPHPSCAIWSPGSPFVGDGHVWVPTPQVAQQALCELGCKIVGFDEGPDAMGSFFVCGKKVTDQ